MKNLRGKQCHIFTYGGIFHDFRIRVSRWKQMVGERGFEPPTPWSRTRFQTILKSAEIDCFQVIDIEPVAGRSWKVVVLVGFWRL